MDMVHVVWSVILVALLIGLLAACTGQPSGTPTTPPSPPSPLAPETRPPWSPEADALVAKARADLAQRLGIQPQAVVVTSVQAVEWPTSALGCPEPGKVYLQVITPGYRILLTVGEKVYAYHASRSDVFYCARPEAPVRTPGSTR